MTSVDKNPELIKQLIEWLGPTTTAGILAAVVSWTMAIYRQARSRKPIRRLVVFLGGVVCGFLALGAAWLLEALGADPVLALFVGIVIGFMGVDEAGQLLKSIAVNRMGGSNDQSDPERYS